MKKVCMIGTGYVGLVTGACLAEIGHSVMCVDKDKSKIDVLNSGGIPIYEPGLDRIVKKNTKAKRLRFSTSIKEGVTQSEVIFICVNTPPLPDGGADLSFVEACTREVASFTTSYKLLVEKSTVPVQTGERIKKTLADIHSSPELIEVASNPEFLREGTAIADFLKPDRVVVGVGSKKAERIFHDLYGKLKAPLIVTDIKSAELIKHASNSFLALKISYINAIAQICEKVGANVAKVSEGMGLDRRIGRSFLNAGLGYGGSCFPKDVSAFIRIAEKNGYDFQILKAAEKINTEQRHVIVKKLEDVLWTLRAKVVAVLGLAFKPDTDDLRNAPSFDIIKAILNEGGEVRAYDPVAMDKAKQIFPQITYAKDPYQAAEGADAAVIVTEWNDIKKINLGLLKKKLKTPIVVDGRNIFDPVEMKSKGFNYQSVGRPA